MKKAREFWVKATGNQVNCLDDIVGLRIDLTEPGEDRWIYTHIQTVDPGSNSVAKRTKWIHVREVIDPCQKDEVIKIMREALESMLICANAVDPRFSYKRVAKRALAAVEKLENG